MTPEQDRIWYAVIQNKADGPHTAQDIQQMLNLGKLNFTDFVFKPGLSAWTPISEFKEFERRNPEKEITEISEQIPEENLSEGWILLIKNTNSVGQKNLIQSGPYSIEQVREKLIKKEASYDDLIWQSGFKQWTKIGSLDIFDRRRPEGFEKQPKPHFSNDTSSQKTVVLEKKEAPVVEEMTVTVSGMDLEKTKPEIKVETKPETKIEAKPEIKQEEAVKESAVKESIEEEVRPRKKGSSFLIASSGALVAILFAYLGLTTYKQTLLQKFPASGPLIGQIESVINAQKHAIPAPVAKVDAVKPLTPQLKVVSLRSNTPAKPQILFETNLPAGTSIAVDVIGESGKILNYPRLSLKKEVRVVTAQMPTIDLSADDLPPGDYKITATASSGLTAQTEMKVGVHDAELSKKISIYQAKLVGQEKKERSALFKSAKWLAVENIALQKITKDHNKNAKTKNLAVWKKNYSKKMTQNLWAEKTNPKTMIYPQAYAKLSQAAKTLSARTGSRAPASNEDFNRKYQELQGELKGLNFSIKK